MKIKLVYKTKFKIQLLNMEDQKINEEITNIDQEVSKIDKRIIEDKHKVDNLYKKRKNLDVNLSSNIEKRRKIEHLERLNEEKSQKIDQYRTYIKKNNGEKKEYFDTLLRLIKIQHQEIFGNILDLEKELVLKREKMEELEKEVNNYGFKFVRKFGENNPYILTKIL